MHDIIRSEVVPVVRLQTVFRQKDGGRIVTNAHLINRGRLPVVDIGGEFQFLEIADEKSGAVLISKLYAQEIKQTGDKFSVQVLSPMFQCFFPMHVGVAVEKMVVMMMPVRISKIVSELAVG